MDIFLAAKEKAIFYRICIGFVLAARFIPVFFT